VKNPCEFLVCGILVIAAAPIYAAAPAAKTAAAAASAVRPGGAAPVATEPKLRPATLSVAQILERNAAARGGLEAWRKVSSLSMSGKMDAGRARVVHPEDYAAGHKRPLNAAGSEPDRGTLVQVPFTMEFKRPRKSRVEIDFHGQKAVQVYDGQKGYKLRPYLNRSDWQPFNANETKAAAEQQELDGALLDYAAKGTRIEVEGMAPVEGHDAFRLKLKFKDGQEERIWVDASSFLEVRIDGARAVGPRSRPLHTYLRDYRPVNGLKVPFLTETQVEGRADPERIIVDAVTVNPTLDNARFAPPVGAASPKPGAQVVPAPAARN
jgi:hypothetical protein